MGSYGADGPVGEAGNGNRTNTNTNTITITITNTQLQVVKAGNGNGTSQLTAPLKFITADKYNNHISVGKLSEFSKKNPVKIIVLIIIPLQVHHCHISGPVQCRRGSWHCCRRSLCHRHDPCRPLCHEEEEHNSPDGNDHHQYYCCYHHHF